MTRPRTPPRRRQPTGYDLWWPRVVGALRDLISIGVGVYLLLFKDHPSVVTQMLAVALLGGTASYAAARSLDKLSGGGSGNGNGRSDG